jgi:hypothetical protein
MLKKYILLLFTLLFYVGFKSQTLYTPNIPTSGVTYNVSVKSDTTMFSQQGPWDFSSTTTTSNENIQILPISSSTIGSNYPNASHVKYEGGEQFFIGFDSSSYTFHGEVSVLTSSYSSPLIIHPYPFSNGDIHTDYEVNIPFTIPGGPPFLERNDQVISRALETGEITMPDGTVHNNALLVRTTRTFTDGQIGSAPCITTLDQYHWWIMGYAIPVVQISTLSQTGACPPSSPVRKSKFLIGNPFANIEKSDNINIRIFPNPSNDKIYINSSVDLTSTTYTIYDNLGRKTEMDFLKLKDNTINVSSLTKGLYILNISGEINKSIKFYKN